MSNSVAYITIDPSLTPGSTAFRCPHHTRHTFRYIPGVGGGETKSECSCYSVPRVLFDGRVLLMIIREDDGQQSPLRRFMERANSPANREVQHA